MKWLKIAMLVGACVLGFIKAFTESRRVIYYYVNNCDGYIRLNGVFEPLKCLSPSPNPCYYTTSVDLGGGNVTKETLDQVGRPSTLKRCYRLNNL
jgi:hypothetical protein